MESKQIEMMKRRNLLSAKINARAAMDDIAAILSDLEKNDGTFIATRDVDDKVISLIAYIAALNTMNGYEP